MSAILMWAALALAPLSGDANPRCPECDCCGCCAKGVCTCDACECCCCVNGACEGCCKLGS
jgi:hypothetical protein